MNTTSFNKRLVLAGLAVSSLVAPAFLLISCLVARQPGRQKPGGQQTGLQKSGAPGINAAGQFAPVAGSDLEAIYHDAWLALPKFALDQEKFVNWSQWEHKFDGKIKTERQLRKAIAQLIAGTRDDYMLFLSQDEMKVFEQSAGGKVVGIGVSLKGQQIVSVITYSPAGRADLKAGDIIACIDGHRLFPGCSTTKVMAILRGSGQAGTKVRLVVMRNHKPMRIELIREVIRNDQAVRSYLGSNADYEQLEQTPPRDTIGSIRIDNLRSETVASELESQLKNIEPVEGIVLDLRRLKGGTALNAARIAAFFLDGDCRLFNSVERVDGQLVSKCYQLRQGRLVITTIGPEEKFDELIVDTPVNRFKETIFVIVDDETSGCAELIAAALKGSKRATIYGDKTAGKATGQKCFAIGHGYVLWVTVTRYTGPEGQPIDNAGVKPNRRHKRKDDLFGAALDALRLHIKDLQAEAAAKAALEKKQAEEAAAKAALEKKQEPQQDKPESSPTTSADEAKPNDDAAPQGTTKP